MPERLFIRIGNKRYARNELDSDGSVASEAESDDFQFKPSDGSNSSAENCREPEGDGNVTAHPSRAAGLTDTSAPPTDQDPAESGATNPSSDVDPYTIDYGPSTRRSSRWRGDRPKGDWKTRARSIDFTDSQDIEEKIPPYSNVGDRYGQEPFPLCRLQDENGEEIQDPIQCYRIVTEWRKLDPKAQEKEYKLIERREKEAEQAAKKRASDDKRNAKKKADRRAGGGLKKRGRKKKADAPLQEIETEVNLCVAVMYLLSTC